MHRFSVIVRRKDDSYYIDYQETLPRYAVHVCQQGDGHSGYYRDWFSAKRDFLYYTRWGAWGRTVTLTRSVHNDPRFGPGSSEWHSGRVICTVRIAPEGLYESEKEFWRHGYVPEPKRLGICTVPDQERIFASLTDEPRTSAEIAQSLGMEQFTVGIGLCILVKQRLALDKMVVPSPQEYRALYWRKPA